MTPRPPRLSDGDEATHPRPDGDVLLWGDTFWVSVVDPEADVFGVNHFHLTNRGYARFTALYVVDGQVQLYGNKVPYQLGDGGAGAFGDGCLTYEVTKPFEELRIICDGPRFGFDLTFAARFDAFDYHDCVSGDPLTQVPGISPTHGGHYEQAMHTQGIFEARGGARAGEARQINSWAHRDHSWSARFAHPTPWAEPEGPDVAGHFWPSIQLPERHINAFGLADPAVVGLETGASPVGGWIADADGARPLIDARCARDDDDLRRPSSFRYALTTQEGETIHVRSTRHYGQVKLWCRGEDDLENRLDCYEAFVGFEVEETGEQGYGVAEFSVMPPRPRWLV